MSTATNKLTTRSTTNSKIQQLPNESTDVLPTSNSTDTTLPHVYDQDITATLQLITDETLSTSRTRSSVETAILAKVSVHVEDMENAWVGTHRILIWIINIHQLIQPLHLQPLFIINQRPMIGVIPTLSLMLLVHQLIQNSHTLFNHQLNPTTR